MNPPTEPSEPDFEKLSTKERFLWGCLSGFIVGIVCGLGFAFPPSNNFLLGLISIPISTIIFGLIFLLFGKTVSRYLWAIIKALQM
jgi:hypothetical protein